MRLLVLSLLLSSALTNADIVKLVQAGLSPETIETKIDVSESAFDTSADALVALAGQGVPDRVIRRMVLAAARPAARPAVESAPAAPPAPAPAPAAPAPAPRAVTPGAPAPPTAAPATQGTAPAGAPKPFTRRYDVEILTAHDTRCTGAELRIDGKGLAASRCRKLDFTLPWASVVGVCYTYGFRGTVSVETAHSTHRLSTTTPAEARRIVDHIRVNAPGVVVAPCEP